MRSQGCQWRSCLATSLLADAGFEGESVLLEGLVKRGLSGRQVAPDLYEQPGMLAYITHDCRAPWQTAEWREQMRGSLRPNAYARLIENRFVSTESSFVPMEWVDACTDPDAWLCFSDRGLEVWVGVDASVKRDSTAIVACTWDDELREVVLVWHRIWQPSPSEPLDFEATVEEAVRDLMGRFRVKAVRFDPYQMQATAQRLSREGVPMVEFPQSVPNLTEASTNLYELLKSRSICLYPDIWLALQRAVAVQTSRGWRIGKQKQAHRIDVVVALAQAALGAVKEGQKPKFWVV